VYTSPGENSPSHCLCRPDLEPQLVTLAKSPPSPPPRSRHKSLVPSSKNQPRNALFSFFFRLATKKAGRRRMGRAPWGPGSVTSTATSSKGSSWWVRDLPSGGCPVYGISADPLGSKLARSWKVAVEFSVVEKAGSVHL